LSSDILHVNEIKGNTSSKLTGKWQGKTGSGRQVVLDARVDGQQLAGRITLAEQSAEITGGKVEERRSVSRRARLTDER